MQIDNSFILQHRPLVLAIVHQYPVPSIPREDLIQEAYIGLIEAARHFDSTQSVAFSGYAAWWIRKYIIRAIQTYGYIVALPRKRIPDHFYTEPLDRIVTVEDGDAITYADVLRSHQLDPEQQLILRQGMDIWNELKKQKKMQKKRTPVGKFIQKCVNK